MMTEIQKPLSAPSSALTVNGGAIDDDAYLMTMVEDSLLPSNMTFSGLFEGDNELNPDELSGKQWINAKLSCIHHQILVAWGCLNCVRMHDTPLKKPIDRKG